MNPIFSLRNDLEFILASASPRRASLLGTLGFPFSIIPATGCEPEPEQGEDACEFVKRCALSKGRASMKQHNSKYGFSVVLSADTIVCLNAEIMGKPRDKNDASAMLSRLNGKCHEVITGFYLAIPKNNSTYFEMCDYESSSVLLGKWSQAVLNAYVESGEPMDKAGAYAIQGMGAFLVQKVTGSWTNVVGLPLEKITSILLHYGIIAPS